MNALMNWIEWDGIKRLPESSRGLLIAYLLMLLIGWLMVTSASMAVSESIYGNPFYLSLRQGIYVLLAIPATMLALILPMNFWLKMSGFLLLFTFALLVAVLIPSIGNEVNGSARWIGFGFFNVQPSEVAKVTVVIYIAGFLVRREQEVKNSWKGFAKPLLVLCLTTVLLLMEPDFGASVVLAGTILVMLFLGGVKAWQFFLLCAGILAAASFVAVLEPYRVERLTAFTNPWSDANVFGSGYQLTQSLIAFGRGELFGTGLGQSLQKLFYLPEAHTDFVFAIWAEETGLVGAIFILSILALFIYKGIAIGFEAARKNLWFHSYVATGLSIMIAIQSFINIGVNTGMLPTKGLTLPFLSYGGSSLLILAFAVGLLLRVALEVRKHDG